MIASLVFLRTVKPISFNINIIGYISRANTVETSFQCVCSERDILYDSLIVLGPAPETKTSKAKEQTER